jgi:hypothetical protein
VEFDHLLRQGVWFPRWASDLGYGYGYPLFNYYPPLTYYLGALFHALGLGFEHSLIAVYGVALTLAVIGAFLLARELTQDDLSGYVAAAAYGTAPYVYFNLFARSAVPETLALGLLPLMLWAYARLARAPSRPVFALAALTYTALIITHFLSAILAVPLLLVIALTSAPLPLRAPSPTRPVSPSPHLPLAAFLLALALSAFFLLPALFETSAVQVHQLTAPGDLDFRNNFLPLTDLLAWPRPYDARLVFIGVSPSLNLGVVGVVVVLVGWVIKSKVQSPKPKVGGTGQLGPSLLSLASNLQSPIASLQFFIPITFLIYSFFTTPLSRPLWETLPFANILQFPWRLVGPASLLLALWCGLLVRRGSSIPHHPSPITNPSALLRASLQSLIPSLFFFASLTWTYASPTPVPFAPTIPNLTAYEQTGQLGATSAGEFLPSAVQQLPPPLDLAAPNFSRLAPVPEGVSVTDYRATPLSISVVVSTTNQFPITLYLFYFPGWRATVDGVETPITPSVPNGLITLTVPSGQHTLTITFGDTPLRTFSAIISILALIALLPLTLAPFGGAHSYALLRFSPTPALSMAPSHPLPVTLTALALLALRLATLDHAPNPFNYSRFNGESVAGISRPLDVNFENQLVLIGLDQASITTHPLPITLYFRAQTPPTADYSVSLQLVDNDGNLFGQSDSQHPGRLPTSRWRLDQYAQDTHTLAPFPGTPPGRYHLQLSVYQASGPALSVLNADQIPQGTAYDLGEVTLPRATPPADLPFGQTLGSLTLRDSVLDTPAPQAGDEVRLTLFWQAMGASRPDVALDWELVGGDGTVWRVWTLPPARADYGTAAWAEGEVVRAPVRLRVPATAPAGRAALRVRVTGDADTEALNVATLDIRVPPRSFTLPTMQQTLNLPIGDAIQLLGFDRTASGITLYWQALAPMEMSYTAFAHALNAEGRVIAQVDNIPAAGSRPTTGWLPGEVITDTYALDLSGAAHLDVGFYDPKTLTRLGAVALTP